MSVMETLCVIASPPLRWAKQSDGFAVILNEVKDLMTTGRSFGTQRHLRMTAPLSDHRVVRLKGGLLVMTSK